MHGHTNIKLVLLYFEFIYLFLGRIVLLCIKGTFIGVMTEKFGTDIVSSYNSKYLEHSWKDGRKYEIVPFGVKKKKKLFTFFVRNMGKN